jgi:hypothetical protein
LEGGHHRRFSTLLGERDMLSLRWENLTMLVWRWFLRLFRKRPVQPADAPTRWTHDVAANNAARAAEAGVTITPGPSA